MNTKNKLNCFVFSNLIVGFLTLNLMENNSSQVLMMKTSNTTLNKIYEKGNVVETVSVPDTIISSEALSTNVTHISLKSNNTYQNSSYEKPSYNSLTGNNLVNYAKKFLGLRYVSAGRSLATGTDCSGFTSLIYKEFGISLGTTVRSQVYSGTYVSKSDLEPGDLVFYSYGSNPSHVAIYIGNGLIIHESNPRDGVKISSVNIMNYITARRVITSNITTKNNNEEVKPVLHEKKEEVKVETKTEDNVLEKEVVKDNKVQNVKEEIKSIDKKENQVKEEIKKQEQKEVKEIKEEVKEESKTEEKKEVKEESKTEIKNEQKEESKTEKKKEEAKKEVSNEVSLELEK